ncbi:MAG: winged helix-turn-helix domain-containing protein [Candidatus Altiarchaeota archaeon]|nr:winged helix-turn-helix domain-containing protein [Candidatus Altiarchaeota archaeon]
MVDLWGEIGGAAGKVFDVLASGKEMDVGNVKKKTKLDDSMLNMALGWLAREDKIVLNKGKQVTAKLK